VVPQLRNFVDFDLVVQILINIRVVSLFRRLNRGMAPANKDFGRGDSYHVTPFFAIQYFDEYKKASNIRNHTLRELRVRRYRSWLSKTANQKNLVLLSFNQEGQEHKRKTSLCLRCFVLVQPPF
jgi:hypothetical protein